MYCSKCGVTFDGNFCPSCGNKASDSLISNDNANNNFYKEFSQNSSDNFSDDVQSDDAFNYDSMDGHQFEYFCAEVLSKNGYQNVEVTKGSGDQGIDVLAEKDGIKYAVQCKCYSSDIGNKAVQEAFSGKTFYNCHVAVVLTNRYFTTSAKELAEKNSVLLWDRDKLNFFICQANGISYSDFQRKYEYEKQKTQCQNTAFKAYNTQNNYSVPIRYPVYRKEKNKWISLLLCIFTICGHKFYEGKIAIGILYFLTAGLFGIGWIIDIFLLLSKSNPYYV